MHGRNTLNLDKDEHAQDGSHTGRLGYSMKSDMLVGVFLMLQRTLFLVLFVRISHKARMCRPNTHARQNIDTGQFCKILDYVKIVDPTNKLAQNSQH